MSGHTYTRCGDRRSRRICVSHCISINNLCNSVNSHCPLCVTAHWNLNSPFTHLTMSICYQAGKHIAGVYVMNCGRSVWTSAKRQCCYARPLGPKRRWLFAWTYHGCSMCRSYLQTWSCPSCILWCIWSSVLLSGSLLCLYLMLNEHMQKTKTPHREYNTRHSADNIFTIVVWRYL